MTLSDDVFAPFEFSESVRVLQKHVARNNFLCIMFPCTGNQLFCRFWPKYFTLNCDTSHRPSWFSLLAGPNSWTWPFLLTLLFYAPESIFLVNSLNKVLLEWLQNVLQDTMQTQAAAYDGSHFWTSHLFKVTSHKH